MAEPQELARMGATGPRRVIGVGTMGGLGVLLLWLALTEPPTNVLWQVFLVAFGVAALWMAQFMWRATGRELVLTEAGLNDSMGTVLAELDNIAKVDRSAFAMKPSNGFLITLKEPRRKAWQPGLWWRTGRRVAIGGVTAARDTKPMADLLTMLVAQRDGTLPEQFDDTPPQ